MEYSKDFEQQDKSEDIKALKHHISQRNKSKANKDREQELHDNVIERHDDFLIDRMSPEFGLVDKLYSNGTISNLQRKLIESSRLFIEERNELLLKHIVKKNARNQLFEALNECGQSYLVKYMEADGVYRPEFGGNWPLQENESTIILKNFESLVDLLDSSDLVGLLYQTGVLNKRQRNLISSKRTPEKQNKVLLEILRKGSLDNYWQTIRCLHLSKQSHIAKIFESGGVVARIDANLQTETSNLTDIENFLATEITNLLRQTPHSEASRILGEVQLDLVGAAAKHSVSLYFLCTTQSEIDRLEQMTSDGQLKKIVEDLFNRLMIFRKRIEVIFKWSRDIFSTSRKCIKEIQVKNFIDKSMKTTIEFLPFELLDTILQKVYIWSILKDGDLNGDIDFDIIRILASVDASWLQRIQRMRFKQPIWPHLERIYRRKFEMYFSFRGLLRYMEEAIQVEEIRVRRQDLMAADFLTDFQISRQLRKRITNEKRGRRTDMMTTMVKEILKVKRGFLEESKYNNFICFLRHTKQSNEARVLEQEGTISNVEIKRPKNSKTDDWSREFSSRLNNLKDRNQVKSEDMEMIIQQLKDSGLEILDSFVDRGVNVWIWCDSQAAVEMLKVLYKSQALIDHLYRLANENDRDICNKYIHVEECYHLKIGSRGNIIINFEEEIQMDDDLEWLNGAAKLRNKIIALGRSNLSNLFVFDDQHPFRLLRKITFEQIKSATDISFFEKNFCLYIADYKAKCIWKIRPKDEDKIEDGTFTCTSLKCPDLSKFDYFRMTITDEGQILIIGDRKPILLFYESESALNCPIRIELPADIKQPEQVAKNAAGNFIFLHRVQKIDDDNWTVVYRRTSERDSSVGDDPWVVSEVDRNGKSIIRQQLGTGNQWLYPDGLPFLLVDSEDRIFLSDKWKHRLILLDSRLRHLRSFKPPRRRHIREDEEKSHIHSWKMCFDSGRNQLLLAGVTDLLVYNITGF